MKLPPISEVRKAVINVCTVVGTVGPPVASLATDGLLPAGVAYAISAAVGLTGTVLHYLVPNETTDPDVAATQSVRLKQP